MEDYEIFHCTVYLIIRIFQKCGEIFVQYFAAKQNIGKQVKADFGKKLHLTIFTRTAKMVVSP